MVIICPKCKKHAPNHYPLDKPCFYCGIDERKVPDTEVASLYERKQKHKRASHMGKERELREKLRILKSDAHDLYDELDAIFFKIAQVNAEIEEQVENQVVE